MPLTSLRCIFTYTYTPKKNIEYRYVAPTLTYGKIVYNTLKQQPCLFLSFFPIDTDFGYDLLEYQ